MRKLVEFFYFEKRDRCISSSLDLKKNCFQGPGGGGQQAGRGLEATSAAGRDTEEELSGEVQPDSHAQVST